MLISRSVLISVANVYLNLFSWQTGFTGSRCGGVYFVFLVGGMEEDLKESLFIGSWPNLKM